MASGGNDRQTGTVPKTKARNNCNVPQEVVTPTRRDIHSTNIMTNSVDWLPVSEHNSRQTQNRARKPTNAPAADNDYTDLDSSIGQEGGSRFVPVRPQPRTLVLRQRDSMMDNADESAYNTILGGHSPHTSHTAVMIVNPTTPNSNQANQNMNPSNSGTRNSGRGLSAGRDTVFVNNTVPVGPYPAVNNANAKSNNLAHDIHDSSHHNGISQHTKNDMTGHNHQIDQGSTRAESVRTMGESMVTACPDTARVEQRLGQIREYIRVTSTLVDSMRNSEDEEALPRPSSVQSSGSAYSDNDLWQSELKAKMEVSQLRLAAALQEQKRLLKYQADAKEQLTEMNLQNGHVDNAGVVCNHDSINHHQQQHETGGAASSGYVPVPAHHLVTSQNAGRSYGSNQIGVATTLPHISDTNQNSNQGCRARGSSRLPDSTELSRESEERGRGVTSAAPVLPSDQAEIDMLRDLQMRRQHLESQILQVAKMQNLHTGTSSLGDVGVESQSVSGTPEGRDVRGVKTSVGNANGSGGAEGVTSWVREEEEEGANNLEGTLKTKMAAVNVMKIELERLKNMLRTVDSIQNNFGINTTFDEYGPYENTLLMPNDDPNRNQNRLVDPSSFNNVPLCRTDSSQSANMMKEGQSTSHPKNQNTSLGLSRLQNCISSGSNKCTNVSEQQHQSGGENISLGLAAMQQLTQQMKQEVQGISDERRRLKHASNRDICTSSGSSIKSDDKKRTNSIGGGHSNTSSNNYPNPGPIERRQLVLKAELEAKKRQLERLMSKEVDHRTNQQPQLSESENSSKASVITAERSGLSDEAVSLNPAAVPASTLQRNSLRGPSAEDEDYSCSVHVRTDVDNGYSSDQEEDEAYCGTPHTQLNINQLTGGASSSRKMASGGSSPENFKTSSFYGDSTQSLDGSFVSQHMKHNKAQRPRGNVAATSSGSKQRNREPPHTHRTLRDATRQPQLPELSPRRPSFPSNRPPQEMQQDRRIVPEPLEREMPNLPPSSQPLTDSLICLPAHSKASSSGVRHREGHDGSMSNNSRIDLTEVEVEVCSHLDSGSTSTGERDLSGVPPPMATLPQRHHRQSHQNDQAGYLQSELGPAQWHNPHSESQVTMWWHNKANQLQQQLEMTSNLCQSLLQDRRPAQVGAVPPPVLMSGLVAPALLPYGGWGATSAETAAGPWWAMMQQQQQQQQLAAAAWGGNCLQHMLAQQREISSLRTALTNLEERVRWMSCGPRARSTPPDAHRMDAAPSARANSAHSAGPALYWNGHGQIAHPATDVGGNVPWPVQPGRPAVPSDSYLPKDEPDYALYPSDHGIRPPANFAPPCEQSSDRGSVSTVTFDASGASHPPTVFNDCTPLARPNLNNINLDCSLNMNPAAGVSGPARAPLNRSAALNNQVPPGNRANNYWDNFRSYSRQNLLSGSGKTNADPSFPVHGPHPLAERSHNTLHAALPRSSAAPPQSANAPKRNVDNPLGNANASFGSHVNPLPRADAWNDPAGRRGRRNLSQESASGPAPPDVLNVNQNAEAELNRSSGDADGAPAVDRFYGSINLNRFGDRSSVPEIVRAHSNNLNAPRAEAASKKKSSSRLPAKNPTEAGRHGDATAESEATGADPASMTREDGADGRFFDPLCGYVPPEAAASLTRLFGDLRRMSSDPRGRTALRSIREVASRYTATESDLVEDAGPPPDSTSHDDSEIIRFIVARHRDACTAELLDSLRSVVLSTGGDFPAHSQVRGALRDAFADVEDHRPTDIGDDQKVTVADGDHDTHSDSRRRVVPLSHQEGCLADTSFRRRADSSDAGHSNPGQDGPSGSAESERRIEGRAGGDEATGSDRRVTCPSEPKIDLIESVETYNGDLAEADQSRRGPADEGMSASGGSAALADATLPDVVDAEEQTPTEAEAEWLGLDRVPTRLQTDDCPGNQSDSSQS